MTATTWQLTIPSPVNVFDDVATHLLPELRADLARYRLLHPRSANTLNAGGWRSGEIFYQEDGGEWQSAAFTELSLRIHAIVGKMPHAGWAMINRNGSKHRRHRHVLSKITGVYYIDPGDPPAPTLFEIGERDVPVYPIAGRLVTFPGDLWHSVPEVKSTVPRITVAFDVR